VIFLTDNNIYGENNKNYPVKLKKIKKLSLWCSFY